MAFHLPSVQSALILKALCFGFKPEDYVQVLSKPTSRYFIVGRGMNKKSRLPSFQEEGNNFDFFLLQSLEVFWDK